jgi:hypothetical protein
MTSALGAALRQMAGQRTPAVVNTETTGPAKDFASIINNLGVRKYLVLGTLIMVGSQSGIVAATLLVGLT